MNILVDTREKSHWDFFPESMEKKKLPCGDYTTSLLLGRYAVERKASTGEIYMNLGKKKNYERFHREMSKLLLLDNAEVVLECSESDVYSFPENSGIPRFRYPSKYEVANGREAGKKIDAWAELRISSKRLRSLIREVSDVIPVVFCGDRRSAQEYVLGRFKELECNI
jgi:CHAD domain-containing protein